MRKPAGDDALSLVRVEPGSRLESKIVNAIMENNLSTKRTGVVIKFGPVDPSLLV